MTTRRFPMPYKVWAAGSQVAAFKDYLDACDYARRLSREPALVDVTNKTGIIDQYDAGQPTPEFRGRHFAIARRCA